MSSSHNGINDNSSRISLTYVFENGKDSPAFFPTNEIHSNSFVCQVNKNYYENEKQKRPC